MAVLTEKYKNRARREHTKKCALCRGALNADENERGVVEFYDGWFWICSECRSKVGREFDCTQHDGYGQGSFIPYHKRSLKYSLRWLEEQYQIELKNK